MLNQTLHIATRKSPLALWQANFVRNKLLEHWPALDIQLLPMSTSGDRFTKNKLQALGGKGLFVKELEEAMLTGQAQLAVHSMKDVPALLAPKLTIAAILKRENPFDALLSLKKETLKTLKTGAVIGTSSLRRASQLLALRPDFNIKLLRGNVQTRLSKLENKDYDAIILAFAGLKRLGLTQYVSEELSLQQMLPACGQGALGLECREDDVELLKLLAPLNHPMTALSVQAERQVNALLGGNCHVPLAVYCTTLHEQIHLQAKVLNERGTKVLFAEAFAPLHQGATAAASVSEALLEQGAKHLLGLNA